jgi:hypothetical protein
MLGFWLAIKPIVDEFIFRESPVLQSRFRLAPWFPVRIVKICSSRHLVYYTLSVSVCWALNINFKCAANIIWN